MILGLTWRNWLQIPLISHSCFSFQGWGPVQNCCSVLIDLQCVSPLGTLSRPLNPFFVRKLNLFFTDTTRTTLLFSRCAFNEAGWCPRGCCCVRYWLSVHSSAFIALVPSSLLSVSIYPAFDLHAIIIVYLSPHMFFTICIQLLLIFLFTCINQLGTYFVLHL